jgi:hypothetical protein
MYRCNQGWLRFCRHLGACHIDRKIIKVTPPDRGGISAVDDTRSHSDASAGIAGDA